MVKSRNDAYSFYALQLDSALSVHKAAVTAEVVPGKFSGLHRGMRIPGHPVQDLLGG